MNPIHAHEHAIAIELILRRVFGCNRGGLSGLIDADSIERNWYPSIAAGLGFMYAVKGSEKRVEIEKFINDFDYYLDIGLYELLGFESGEKVINGVSRSINYRNGEEAVRAVIIALSDLCE